MITIPARFLFAFLMPVLVAGVDGDVSAQTMNPPPDSLHYRAMMLPQNGVDAATAVSPAAPSSWMGAAPYPTTIARYAAAQNGNSLYVISGFSNGLASDAVRRYDAATNTWTSLTSIPAATEAPVAVYYKDKIYMADGYGAASENRLRIYDVASDTWSAGPVRPGVISSYGAAIAAYNDKIYVVGGFALGTGMIMSIYDIASGTWSVGSPPPVSVYFAGYKQMGQFLYVAGGFSRTPAANSTVTMRFDLASGTWTSGPVFTPQRGDFALAASGTKLFAIGGDANGGDYFTPTTEVDELDTSTWPAGSWQVSPDPLPVARQANKAGFFTDAIIGGEIWSTGGFAPGGTYLDDHLFRAAPQSTPTATPPVPLSAASRKTHGLAGDIDLPLPLTGTPAIESRTGGATNDYEIVVNFATPISVLGFPQATVALGTGTIGSGGIANGGVVTINSSSVVIPLTNVRNGQTLFVKLTGVTSGGPSADITIPIRILVGDVNADGSVNSADAVQIRNRSGQAATAPTFRYDLNADGLINSADALLARAGSGSTVQPAAPLSAVSRKTHGSAGEIDLPLPLNGASGVECRNGGLTSDYEIVVQFPLAVNITGAPQATIGSGSATIGTSGIANGGAVNVNGSTVIIPLTNVANAQALTVVLNDVTDGYSSGAIAIPMRILIGDANGDGLVNSADVTQARNHSGQSTTSTNFRFDFNTDGLINSADVAIARAGSGTSVPAPPVLSAVSRKTHGSAGKMDIVLPLSGTAGVECRSGGLTSDYEIVVTFAAVVAVSGAPQASVTSGSAIVGGAGVATNGNVTLIGSSVIVPLTNVANAQTLAVTLRGVTDGSAVGDVTIPMNVLIGDINGDRVVNSADALQSRSRSGQLVTASSFRSDVNADGAINSADSQIVRSRAGTSLP